MKKVLTLLAAVGVLGGASTLYASQSDKSVVLKSKKQMICVCEGSRCLCERVGGTADGKDVY